LTNDGRDVRFVAETAKPSARESAGGFAFVPLRAAWGDTVGLSKTMFRRCGFFTAAKMQNDETNKPSGVKSFPCKASWRRSSMPKLLHSAPRTTPETMDPIFAAFLPTVAAGHDWLF